MKELVRQVCGKAWPDEVFKAIAKCTDLLPLTPTSKGLECKIIASLPFIVGRLRHCVEANDGCMSTDEQVLILRDNAVEGLKVVSGKIRGQETGGLTIAMRAIPIEKPFTLVGLQCNDMKQVIAEDLTINTLFEEGNVGIHSLRRKGIRVGEGLGTLSAGLGFMVIESRVGVVDLGENYVVD